MTEMPKIFQHHKLGLSPLPKDKRDFRLGYAYPVPKLSELPTGTWHVKEPLAIKDQGPSDFCTGFSSSSVAEDHEGVILVPEYTLAKAKQVANAPVSAYGANLRDVMGAGTNWGFLEQIDSPFTLDRNGRDFCADYRNWDAIAGLNALAAKHKQGSFFIVDGPYDTFDNIRAALWQHRGEFDSVETGSIWYDEFNQAPGGVIPKEFKIVDGPHAYKIFGQDLINGELYLTVQNSYGKNYGNNGLYYMPRAVVNAIIGLYAPFYGIFMFKDLDQSTAAIISQPTLIAIINRIIQSLLFQVGRLKNNQSPNP